MRLLENILAVAILAGSLCAIDIPYPGDKNLKQPIKLSDHGKTYEIKEPDAWEEIVEKAKDFNATKIEKKLENIVKNRLKIDSGMPMCVKKREYIYDPSYIVPNDIYVYGRLIARKGEVINPLQYSNVHNIYLVPLRDKIERAATDNIIKHDPSALVMVAKGDIGKYGEKYFGNIAAYKTQLVEKMRIRCYPAIIEPKGNVLKVTELPYKLYIKRFANQGADK